MRRYYEVSDGEHDSFVFASDHLDALNFAQRRLYDEDTLLTCRNAFVCLEYKEYPFTKLSELPDNTVFYSVLELSCHCSDSPMIKITNMSNNMVRCRYLYDTIRPDSYIKGSTKVAIIPAEEQECLKSGKT